MVQLLRVAATAGAGTNNLYIQLPTFCILKHIEVNTSNATSNAACVAGVYFASNNDLDVTIHPFFKEPLGDGEIVSWTGEIKLNKMTRVRGLFTGSAAGDNIIMTVLIDSEGSL